MNKQLLHEYLLLLLQDNYIGVLQLKAENTTLDEFVKGVLKAGDYLPFYFEEKIFNRLFLLAEENKRPILYREIVARFRIKRSSYAFQKRLPWLIVLFTISLMLVMYYFAKR